MKKLITVVALVLMTGGAFAKGGGGGHSGHSSSTSTDGTGAKSEHTHVEGYSKKDGTYVAPHDRSSADHTKNNNWDTKGNTNPETGKAGTKPGD